MVNCQSYSSTQFKECKEVDRLIQQLSTISNVNQHENDLQKITEILDNYLEQPHLIDPHLENFITQLLDVIKSKEISTSAFHQAFKYLYLFIKVRGYKSTLRHFSHEVSDLEYVLKLLDQQNIKEYATWETRYVTILWLSMVTIIPFDLVKLDGGSCESNKKPIIERIYDSIIPYLSVADKSRDAAAFTLSKFITRPDVKKVKLSPFVEWCIAKLKNVTIKSVNDVNIVSGNLSALSLLFKHGKREDLLCFAPLILETIEELNFLKIENTIIRKLTIKLTQRIGLVFLVPRLASWRYNRGNRSLMENLKSPTEEKKMKVGKFEEKDQNEEDIEVAEEVETVLEILLNGLKDKDTIVRWSAAKGVGRITGRLPQNFADEVVVSLLELFVYTEMDGAWHGGCLALAELGRRGLLLPIRLAEVVPIVLRALRYDERRGSYSVGSHVRDAGCYVCWSFARAYEPEEIKTFIVDIATSLLITTVFDREVNCRRAASAAFQENVGRQGTFPHGIDIVTAADYFAVGSITYCYTELSVYVGGFCEYTNSLIDHLYKNKISHWDRVIREITSRGLCSMTKLDPEYMLSKALPSLSQSVQLLDISTKDGAILAIAEITHALFELGKGRPSDDVLDTVYAVVRNIRKMNQLRGAGGEMLRKSVCRLIENFAKSQIEVPDKSVLDDWLFVIEDTIPNTEPLIKERAIQALPHFLKQYVESSSHFNKDEILKRFLSKTASNLKFDRMGFSQAIGVLPMFMVEDQISTVLMTAINTTTLTDNFKSNGLFAESRGDALNAITSVCQMVTFSNSILCNHVDDIYDCLFKAMNDYTTDSRGDVGAWVREAAMSSLVNVTYQLMQDKRLEFLTKERCTRIVRFLLQQSAEKIDRTRLHAGNLLMELIHHKPEIPHIPRRDKLNAVIPRSSMDMNWSAAAKVFPTLIKLLPLHEYQYDILLGMTVSVGGLTESLVRASSDCLRDYLMEKQQEEEAFILICNNILKILRNYTKDVRIIYPMMKVLDLLLSAGCFYQYLDNNNFKFFPKELVTLMKTEVKSSADAKKLLSSINVFCGLLQFPASVRQSSFSQLMLFLGHKYPKVRQTTAEQLYTALLTYDDIIKENYDDILDRLMETPWNDNVQTIRPVRNQLCEWLDVPVPKLKSSPASVVASQRPVDQFDSYQDLVSRDGY